MNYCANSASYWVVAIIIVGGLEALCGKTEKKTQHVICVKLPEPFVTVNDSHNMQLFVHEKVINDRVMIT